MNIKQWMSTPRDDSTPDPAAMNRGVMPAVIGLVAGLAINALIVVARDVRVPGELLSPRVLFGTFVAALLALSAFGRGKTHFAKGHGYDLQLLVCDFVVIVAASALVGLLNRVTFEFDQ